MIIKSLKMKNYRPYRNPKPINFAYGDSNLTIIEGDNDLGKTTLLNIIGGLDRYDSGDLIIDGVSTKKYNDRGPWVCGDSVTLTKGFHGIVYVRFMDKGGYCNIRKTNTIRIKK